MAIDFVAELNAHEIADGVQSPIYLTRQSDMFDLFYLVEFGMKLHWWFITMNVAMIAALPMPRDFRITRDMRVPSLKKREARSVIDDDVDTSNLFIFRICNISCIVECRKQFLENDCQRTSINLRCRWRQHIIVEFNQKFSNDSRR
jgi:hypothetical protein